MENNRHFTLVVIGDNPEELIKPYDSSIKVEPYIMYRFCKAKEYHEQYISFYEAMLDSKAIDDREKEVIKVTLDHYKSIDDVDFYLELIEGREMNEETGDVWSDENPNGKYDQIRVGDDLVYPLITKDGKEVFTALKKDVDWEKMHLVNYSAYERVWEIVMEDAEPINDQEKKIRENWERRKEYFKFFGTKENYATNQTAFWGYAVVDQNGWKELEDNVSQIEWVGNFYDRFIKPLPDNARISIYECFRK